MTRFLLIPLALMMTLAGCLDGTETDDAVVEEDELFVPQVLATQEWQETGTAMPSVQDPVGATPCEALPESIQEHSLTIPADVDGIPAKASELTVTMTWMIPGDLDLVILDPSGTTLASSTAWNIDTQTFEEKAKAMDLAPGDYTIQVITCTGGGDYELTGSFEMVSVPTEEPAEETEAEDTEDTDA